MIYTDNKIFIAFSVQYSLAGTGLFGQQAQTSTGGLFGSKPGGLFGTNTTSTATSGFGTSAFGTPASSGLFGQTSSAGQTVSIIKLDK